MAFVVLFGAERRALGWVPELDKHRQAERMLVSWKAICESPFTNRL